MSPTGEETVPDQKHGADGKDGKDEGTAKIESVEKPGVVFGTVVLSVCAALECGKQSQFNDLDHNGPG